MFTALDPRSRTALILIILLGFVIRLDSLTQNPIWFDEAMEYWVATAPLDELFPIVKNSLQDPPLYSFLLHFWSNIGQNEFILRLPSTFASVLSIATIYALGKHTHSQTAGLIAALLLVILPPDIRFAQEVGQYALLMLGLLLSLLSISHARKTNRSRYWIAWAIVSTVCVYNYYGSFLIISAVAVAVLFENIFKQQKNALIKQTGVTLLFSALSMPLVLLWLPDQIGRGPTANAFQISFLSVSEEIAQFFTKTKSLLSYQLTGYIAEPEAWENLQFISWAMILLLLLSSLYYLTKSLKHAHTIFWLFSSWIVYYLAGRIGAYPYQGTRHALILTPLLIVSISIGLLALWRIQKILSVSIIVGIVIITMVAPKEMPEDLRQVVTEYVLIRDTNTPTYVFYGAVPGFRYHFNLATDNFHTDEQLPGDWYRKCWAGKPHSYCAENNIFYGKWSRQLSPEEQAERVISSINTPSNAQFWIIFSHTGDEERDGLLNALEETYVRSDSIEETGAGAYLFRKR